MRRLWIAAALGSLALLGLLAWQLAPDASAHKTTLAAARTRWEAHSPPAYQLRMRYEVASPFHSEQCGIEVLVRGEMIDIINNSCRSPMTWTVERLFDSAALPEIRTCYPAGSGGCACLSTFRVQASFDQQAGYPTEISRHSIVSVQWLNAELWQQFLRKGKLPWCVHSAGSSTRTLVVEELAPLP